MQYIFTTRLLPAALTSRYLYIYQCTQYRFYKTDTTVYRLTESPEIASEGVHHRACVCDRRHVPRATNAGTTPRLECLAQPCTKQNVKHSLMYYNDRFLQ